MVSFIAEPIFTIGVVPITNSFIHTLFVDALLIGGIIALKRNLTLIPGKNSKRSRDSY